MDRRHPVVYERSEDDEAHWDSSVTIHRTSVWVLRWTWLRLVAHLTFKGLEMERKAGFLVLAEELHNYILSFLPCRDILRCTSVCKALRQTYMCSSELQYIVELSGQRLLPVPNTDNGAPISERLQLLRDKAHAWFKLDIHSFETFAVPEKMYDMETSVAYGHFYVWDEDDDLAMVVPILPKPSQQTIERDWFIRMLCSVPHPYHLDVLMDLAQNLIAIVYPVIDDTLQSDNETLYIDIRALNSGGVHPQAAGRTLFLSGLSGYDNSDIQTKGAKLKGFGRHIALQRTLVVMARGGALISFEEMWQLQIWDWQHSTTSSSVLAEMALPYPFHNPPDFCFLGNNRLLIVANNLRLYSIQDMSQTPQLLACFLMPVIQRFRILPMDDIAHSSQLQFQAQQISDLRHQLLCLEAYENRVYIISTRIFFNLDGMATAMPIPWKHWGPSNTRIVHHSYQCKIHVSGNRVLQAFPVDTPGLGSMEYILHMMDFSPLAVTNRRGLGRVVKEPSTIDITGRSRESLTTSLPYIEVVSDRVGDLEEIWIDKDRIYLLKVIWERAAVGPSLTAIAKSSTLEVIDV
ncbi:hypothetical protein DFH29DRAFT_1065961 [Suillus ampliporus]|nr:hypothetical protein DFH29DRAFT_1065961 [Suillus ampliporus]